MVHVDSPEVDRTVTEDGTRYRALFISDVHLGTRGAKPSVFSTSCAITMPRRLSGRRYRRRLATAVGLALAAAHNDVVQKLLRKARKGARIVYVPGNHDEFLRGYYGTHFGGVEVAEHAIHEGADGRRYLVIHGDHFDLVVKQARWLALLGDTAYDFAILANRIFNALRRRLGFPYWSLSQWAKLKVKNAVNYIGDFEQTLVEEARRQLDGVICGHIHHAVIHDDFGIRYINCGDWVESCSAVVEHDDGRFEVVRWTDAARTQAAANPPMRLADDKAGIAA